MSDDPLEMATANRLARLGSMPVETSRLDAFIESQILRPRSRPASFLHFRPLRAVAASIATLGIVGVIVWSLSGGTVVASPATMAQWHQEMISGKHTAHQVQSLEQASRILAVPMPTVRAEHVMMCCMNSIEDKRVACVLLQTEGVPVTMAVASASEMRLPKSQVIARDGVDYYVQSDGELNMVMAERGDRWICLIGALPAQHLMQIASEMKF